MKTINICDQNNFIIETISTKLDIKRIKGILAEQDYFVCKKKDSSFCAMVFEEGSEESLCYFWLRMRK